MGYINKEVLLKDLENDLHNDCNIYGYHVEKNIRDDKYYFAIDIIESALEVDVRENIKAVFLQTLEDGYFKRICSHCEKDLTKVTTWIIPKFCPYCGAEMGETVECY